MREIFRVCTSEHHHKFAAGNGDGHFMDVEYCPYCKEYKLETVELDLKSPRNTSGDGGTRHSEAEGFFRGEYIDTLPTLKWFYEIKPFNDPDQPKSGQNWGIDEAKELGKYYEEYGVSDVETWKTIAEGKFKRSIASVERQLRAVIACLNGDKNWEDLFPDI